MCIRKHLTKQVVGLALGLLLPTLFTVSAEGIERLAPARSYGVEVPEPIKTKALAPAQTIFSELLYKHEFDRELSAEQNTPRTSLLAGYRTVRDFSVNHKDVASFNPQSGIDVGMASSVLNGWSLGSSAWRYQGMSDTDLLIGNTDLGVPDWINSPRLGGMQLSQRFTTDDDMPWRYRLSLGALDYSSSVPEGDLKFGPTVSALSVDVGLTPKLQLEGLVESAPGLQLSGVGARYETQDWGAWTSSIARATHEYGSGWRYQMRYDTDILPSVNVGLSSERYQGDFADLSRYGQSSLGSGVKHSLNANVGLGRWGTLKGNYVSERSQFGAPSQRLGLTQQFWYSPNLRLGLQAQRELHNGDYNMVLRLAVPLP